jgi:nicotinamidase/pyrazinamidase
MTTTKALIVVDVQNDFIDGSLAVADGAETAQRIFRLIQRDHNDYAAIVTTQDWHIDPGDHFSETPDFKDSWPVHAVAGTPGSELHPRLRPALGYVDDQFFKGQHAAAYSGFEGTDSVGTDLEAFLRSVGVTEVDVVGIATDYCVKATAIDAAKAGFDTHVLIPYTAAVAPESAKTAREEMTAAGVKVEEVVA